MIYNVESDDLEFGTQAIYSCDTGFSLVGKNTTTCTGDGSSTIGVFDGTAPTCERESTITLLEMFNPYINLQP